MTHRNRAPALGLALALLAAPEAAMADDPPGLDRDPTLADRLAAALAARGPEHVPRTRHLEADGTPTYVNRLILEASPYLLQHAHNPVDWHPWGEDALAKAAAEDKPLFLSVGYATCHWCHVMEEESFDDLGVAELLNRHFVPVKVDREERPDLDQVYIMATQIQNGHAGWPNSVFLRPDGAPFHTGTYLPRPDFTRLLEAVARAWSRPDGRAEIDRVAAKLSEAIRRAQAARLPGTPPPGEEILRAAVDELRGMHNALQGGFSEAQQFPQETVLLFLLDHWRRTGEEDAREMAVSTLAAIAADSIHDHAGGGFHRYAVDPNWRTPHFEKMLYNQALLARAFIEGWEATGRRAFRRAAERAFTYVARDMTDPAGAFYAAEDADSLDAAGEREEGAFYVWTEEEVRAALGDGAERLAPRLGMDAAPTLEGRHVLHLDPVAEPDFAVLDPALARLREAREARPRPIRDEKVIAGWNGLMIRALAEGAVAFDRPDLAERAARAGQALWDRLWDGARLARLWADGAAREPGQLEDHAFLGLGFLALHEATGESLWADRAATLARAADARFSDDAGRLRMAAADGPLGPVYDAGDGATPSGESAALELLARAGAVTGDAGLITRAEELRAALSPLMSRAPLMLPAGLRASRTLDDGPSTLRRTVAGGTVRLHLAGAETGDWILRLKIAPGWHVNARDPGQGWLTGAAVEGAAADWPAGEARALGFSDAPVRVYEGALAVPLDVEASELAVDLQACSESLCREPLRARFRLP